MVRQSQHFIEGKKQCSRFRRGETVRALWVGDNLQNMMWIETVRQELKTEGIRLDIQRSRTFQSSVIELSCRTFDVIFVDLCGAGPEAVEEVDDLVLLSPSTPLVGIVATKGEKEVFSDTLNPGLELFLVKSATTAEVLVEAVHFAVQSKKMRLRSLNEAAGRNRGRKHKSKQQSAAGGGMQPDGWSCGSVFLFGPSSACGASTRTVSRSKWNVFDK